MYNPIVFVYLTPDGSIDNVQVSDEGATGAPLFSAIANGAFLYALPEYSIVITLTDALPVVWLEDEETGAKFLPDEANLVNGNTARYYFHIATASEQTNVVGISVNDGLIVGDRVG